MNSYPVQKFGIRDIVDVAEVEKRTSELRAELLRTMRKNGRTVLPDSEVIWVLDPLAEDDGRLTQEIRLSVLTYKGENA